MFDESGIEKYFLPVREPTVLQSQSDSEFLQLTFDENPQLFLEEQRQDKKNLERARKTAATLARFILEIESGNITPEDTILLSGVLVKAAVFTQPEELEKVRQMLLDSQGEILALEDIIVKREAILNKNYHLLIDSKE